MSHQFVFTKRTNLTTYFCFLKAGATEDYMVGWHRQFYGHEFEKTLGGGEGQGGWHAAFRGVAKIRTCVSDRTSTRLQQ